MVLNTKKNNKYGLFEVTGIELEYMIVDSDNLVVKPISDKLFFDVTGEYVAHFTNDAVEWSNELALHIIELKSAEPTDNIPRLLAEFTRNIGEINNILSDYNAMLLPTAVHPLMNPAEETRLWPHEYSDIYKLYDGIFNCSSHGWGNLQSMHINLPFKNDREFEQLHAAVRILLPIIPSISASSPILEGEYTGYKDSRLSEYLIHQIRMPVLMGSLIPERIYTEEQYLADILMPIEKSFKIYDKKGIMNSLFLNSRGAIARFDRGAIEIRVVDMQECPASDLAIACAIIETLKSLVSGAWSSTEFQKSWHESCLLDIFKEMIRYGENTVITDPDYLSIFGVDSNKMTAGELWQIIFDSIRTNLDKTSADTISMILEDGTLASRIQKKLGNEIDRESISNLYKDISVCLKLNTPLT